MITAIERRFLPSSELRVAGDASAPVIEGHAALFNTRSGDLGGFVEQIAPNAFADAIGRSDIRALYNHDPNFVLGRVSSGTLSVEEDARGLFMRNTPPDTQWARDLLVSMRRGDVTQQSFAFTVESDTWDKVGDVVVRTITKVRELFDVSPVTYPAYPDTAVAVRSLATWRASLEPDSEVDRCAARSLAIAERALQLALTRHA